MTISSRSGYSLHALTQATATFSFRMKNLLKYAK